MAWRGGVVASVALVVALATGGRAAQADAPKASFNCADAKAPVEKLICSDASLAKADADLAALYAQLQESLQGSAHDDLLAEQRAWLKARLSACGVAATGSTPPADSTKAVTCLTGLYRDRIGALQQLASAQPAANPAVPSAQPIRESLPTVLGIADETLPAKGEQQTILSIAQFGRYSVSVKSQQGVAIQLVDRMTGPGETQGEAGNSDGRVDAFLDRGHYKILLHASDQGSGDAALTVHPFAELNGPDIPRLPDIKQIDTTLADYQQRSYWLQIDERRAVAIEAAGRNLADMRLWRDGNWLVDAAPAEAEVEPEPGKPLAVRRIVTTLEPGLYLLSTYGGPGAVWAKTSDEHPLHLRMGVPKIADAGRQAFTASPFGIDRYLVPANANYFRLELPEAEDASIAVDDYDGQSPYSPGTRRIITKQSLPPVAEITDGRGDEEKWKLVTITREAGKPYVLQHFESVSTYYFKGGGDYWIETLHSGYGEDSVDATVLLSKSGIDYPERIIAGNAPELDANAVWTRRFNLLEPVTVYFHVTEAGNYVIDSGGGAKAEYRFEPMIHIGINYKAPDYQPSGYIWALDPGYYIMTGRPKDDGKGILTLTVRGAGAQPDGESQAKETALLLQSQHLDGGFDYRLYLNQQPGVSAGVILRRLPIGLGAGLPVVLKAGQSLNIPVIAPRDGVVTAVAEDAKPLSFTVDHGAPVTTWRSGGGEHVLSLSNTTDKAFFCALKFTPDSLAPETPLPAVSAEALQAIPKFPALIPDQPQYFDIVKDEHRTFSFEIAQPGLYRVESSGLLQTEAAMRTRTVVSLDSEANNGTGRNFLLQQYLGQGSYQITVAAQGETRGHMGVAASQTVLMDGGALSPGVPARNTIAAGNGLVYTFSIPTAGHYHLRALGLGRTFKMRLEDQDGWPVIAPNADADLDQDFAAGTYRLVILPQPVAARIVTLLEPIAAPAPVEGHGPHDLALNMTQKFQWMEPEEGAARSPDQWRIRLTAPTHLAIDLSRGMVADIVGETDGKGFGQVNGGETWKGLLPMGSYLLKATTREPNNRFDYEITATATELLPGGSRDLTPPADIPLSIGSDAVAEIGSFGTRDVRAWLYDAKGALVATNDDRPNDWNFAIAGRIKPGSYRLHVEDVTSSGNASPPAAPADNTVEDGENDQTSEQSTDQSTAEPAPATANTGTGATTISIYQAAEQQEPALAVGNDMQLSGPNVHIVPLTPADGVVLVAAADANGPAVGLGLEMAEDNGWQTLVESTGRSPWVALPVDGAKGPYRLRIWSLDRSTAPIRLQTRMVSPAAQQASRFTGAGIALQPVPGVVPSLGLAAVTVNEAGAYRLEQPLPGIAWSTESGKAFASDFTNVAFGKAGTFWFGARAGVAASVKASKLLPGDDAIALTVRGSAADPTVIADPAVSNGAPLLWIADSRLGQPGAAVAGGGLAVALGSAVAIMPGSGQEGFVLDLWNAGDAASPLPLRLRRTGFAKPTAAALDWGTADWRIAGHQALTLALPKGTKRLQLALPPETAVLPLTNGAPEHAIWSGDAALALTAETGADQLLVLSAASSDAQLGISITPLTDTAPNLGAGHLFKQYFAADGVVRIAVSLSDSEKKAIGNGTLPTLRLAGAIIGVTTLSNGGTVSRDAAPKVTGDALIDIAHGAGPVVAWLDGGDPLTSLGVAANAIQVKATSSLALQGDTQQLVFTVDAPKFLRLGTSTPVITQLNPAEGAQNLRLFENGADLSLYLPQGTTPVVLRAAGDGALAGTAEAVLMDVAPIGEGLGPKVRLAPGESRLFSFAVKDERAIGVGVRGATDSAHVRVLDAGGTEVGGGVIEMLHLKAGTYLLAVDAPGDGTAIEVQPALVGIAAPDGSPPDEVKRGYLELAGLKPKDKP